MLKSLCSRLDATPPFRKSAVVGAIQARIRELHPINVILVLDEMQNADDRILDSVRMLANDSFDNDTPFTCLMLGTPEFFDRLRLAVNESLRQRITYFRELTEVTSDQTAHYLRHCLSEAGAQQEIFEPEAIQLIAESAGGSFRLINQIARTAMAVASAEQSTVVSLSHTREASRRCNLPTPKRLT